MVHDIREEGRRLPQLNRRLWDHFGPVENQKDMEALEQYMADDAIRREFYQRLGMFGRCLHIVLSSEKAVQVIAEEELNRMKEDWKRFSELRRSVRIRYQETVDMREFDAKIQGILDDHVSAEPVETIIEPVNINEEGAVSKVLEEAGISDASKADRIASTTRRCITERMDENPEFHRKFSELLEEAINDYHARRISEKDYLN